MASGIQSQTNSLLSISYHLQFTFSHLLKLLPPQYSFTISPNDLFYWYILLFLVSIISTSRISITCAILFALIFLANYSPLSSFISKTVMCRISLLFILLWHYKTYSFLCLHIRKLVNIILSLMFFHLLYQWIFSPQTQFLNSLVVSLNVHTL